MPAFSQDQRGTGFGPSTVVYFSSSVGQYVFVDWNESLNHVHASIISPSSPSPTFWHVWTKSLQNYSYQSMDHNSCVEKALESSEDWICLSPTFHAVVLKTPPFLLIYKSAGASWILGNEHTSLFFDLCHSKVTATIKQMRDASDLLQLVAM